MSVISVRELRNHTADVVRRVRAGESIEVTVYGEPVMELRPIAKPRDWLDELMSTPAVSTGWAKQIEDERASEMALDWPED